MSRPYAVERAPISSDGDMSASVFQKRARGVWGIYRREIASVDPDLMPVAREYLLRFEKARPESQLNVLAPIVLCRVFGVTETYIIQNVALGHLYLDHFTQVLDDNVDRGESDGVSQHLAHVLMLRAISHFCRVSEKSMGEVIGHLEKVMKAERALWWMKRGAAGSARQEMDALALRGGSILCGALVLKGLTGKSNIYYRMKRALRAVSIGIQLADDICDWREDWREGNLTGLLSLAIANDPFSIDEGSEEEVAKLIVKTKAISRIGTKAVSYLRQAADELRTFGQEYAARHLESIGGYVTKVGNESEQMPIEAITAEALEKISRRYVAMMQH